MMKNNISTKKAGYLEGIVSIIINTLLFVLKLWAGTVSGSLALIADAWHTLSDSASSVIVIVGTKLSNKKPDEEHPFGYGRLEHIASLFIGMLLGIVAFEFLRKSILSFFDRASANFGLIAIIVTISSVLLKEALAQYAFYLGRKSGNSIVSADGWHHRSDALSSVAVLIGIFLNKYFWWVDSVLGMLIALMLFYAVFQIVRESANKLLGEKPSDELVSNIKEILSCFSKSDLKPHHFHVHNYVNYTELTFHIYLDANLTIKEGHEVVIKIEEEIRAKMNIEATIHLDPHTV